MHYSKKLASRIWLGLCAIVLTSSFGKAQSVSLAWIDCQKAAQDNYPQVKQRALIGQSKEYSISNANKGYLPQMQVVGQATYQSEVTQSPMPIPGVEVVSKNQFKFYGELNQTLYDGGNIRNQKGIQSAVSAIDEQKLNVDLYAIKDRVNQLFFGILILEEQLKQNALLQSDISAALSKTAAAVKFGSSLKSNEELFKAELLKAKQRSIELGGTRLAYLNMLGLFMNQNLAENTQLQRPALPTLNNEITRPELNLFAAQKQLYASQMGLVNAKNMPKLNLFAQGGLGRPALDMLSNDFKWYYIGGVRLNWNFSGLYTLQKEKGILGLNQRMVEVQQETFLFNTQNTIQQQNAELNKLNQLVKTDEEIIELRKHIKESAKAQLNNGVITANDYMREVNAEDIAIQNKITHEIQFMMVQYNQQITKGQ